MPALKLWPWRYSYSTLRSLTKQPVSPTGVDQTYVTALGPFAKALHANAIQGNNRSDGVGSVPALAPSDLIVRDGMFHGLS